MLRRPISKVFLAVLVVLVLAILVDKLAERRQNLHVQDANHVLAEADRLALLFNWPKAEPLYAQAEALFDQSGDKQHALYARLGWIWSQAYTGAARKYEPEIAKDLQNPLIQGDQRLVLRSLVAKAAIEQEKNEASAQDTWSKIQRVANVLGDERWKTRAEAEIGIIAFLDGDVEKATRLLKTAILSSFLHGDLGAAIYYVSIVGNGFVEEGQPETGLKYCDIALMTAAIAKDAGFPFMAYEGKARALVALHRESEAKSVLQKALGQARAQNAFAAEAQLLIVLGKQAKASDRVQAIEYLRAAVDLCQRRGFQHAYAWGMYELAKVYRDQGDLRDAEFYERSAMEAMQEVEDKYHLPLHLVLLAELENGRGNLAAADRLYSRAEDVTQGLLLSTPSRQVEADLIATMSEVYLGHFELAIRLRNVKEAYEVLETARGRSIADRLRGGGDWRRQQDPTTSAARQEIKHLQIALLHATSRDERRNLLDRLFEEEQVIAPTGQSATRFEQAALKPAPAKLKAVRRSLRGDETLLEYVLGRSQSYCLYMTRAAVGVSVLPTSRTKVEGLTQRYLEEIKSRKRANGMGRQLYALLLAPIPPRVLKQRIIIVPDGELNSLPFDSLVDNSGHVLIDSHVVTYAPSATVLYLIRKSAPIRQPILTFLGVGDVQYQHTLPTISQSKVDSITGGQSNSPFDLARDPLPDLPKTRDEIVEAGKIFGPKSVELLGDDASEAAFEAEPLDQFRIIDIAVHGIASKKYPQRSALVLGEDSKNQDDGLLQTREIRGLRLRADLVVLSACDTGEGQLLGEEGIANLEDAFLYAGTRSVLASLWTASDAYTTALVEHFYRHLADGQDEGTALREAKLDLIKEFGSGAVPFYWAGFNVVGDASAPVLSPAR